MHAQACIDREAAVVKAVPARYPAGAERLNADVQTLVEIHADGSIASTATYRTSNDSRLDDAADDAANASTFRAAAKNCVEYSSIVILHTPFTNGTRTLVPAAADCIESGALLKSLARPATRQSRTRGDAIVDVTVDSDGKIASADLLQPTGNDRLDAEALRIAKASTYYPGHANCGLLRASVRLELQFR